MKWALTRTLHTTSGIYLAGLQVRVVRRHRDHTVTVNLAPEGSPDRYETLADHMVCRATRTGRRNINAEAYDQNRSRRIRDRGTTRIQVDIDVLGDLIHNAPADLKNAAIDHIGPHTYDAIRAATQPLGDTA